jgi:hypothetical protein
VKIGDMVVRNPRYSWCVCAPRACWCRGSGEWKVVVIRKSVVSQSTVMVKVRRNGKMTDFLDSSYFLPVEVASELKK